MASKKFRGITIEIGADTSKLNKALREINSETSETKKNLKEVERALKLDPSNIVLLEQKQKLLAQSAETAAKKQEVLQQAVAKADQALARGKTYEEKYEPLKNSLSEVSARLDSLREKKKSVDADFLEHKIPHEDWVKFLNEIQSVETEYNTLKGSIVALNKEFEGDKLSQAEYDKLQRELVEASEAAEEAERDFKGFNTTLQRLGTTAQEVSDKARSVSNAFAPVSKAAGVVLGAMLGTVPATDDLRTSMSLLETDAQKAGISMESTADALKQFNRVSGDTDESVEALSNLLMGGATESNLQRAVENLAGAAIAFPETIKIESLADSLQETIASGEATGQFAELLTRLGVSVSDFNTMLGGTQDQSTRLNMAMDVLSNQGMKDFYESWVNSNEALVENKDSMLSFQQSLANLATALTPIVTMVTGFLTKLLDWFADLDPGTQKAIFAFLGITAAVSPIAGMIADVGGAVGTLTDLAGKFAGGAGDKMYITFVKWAGIIALVAGAIAGLIAMINVLLGKGNESSRVLGQLGSVGKTNISTGSSSVPGFANGGVFMPNHPVLGILGDNKSEVEIAAPKSAMQDAFLEALATRGGGGATKVNIEFRGSLAQLGRVLQPVVTTETSRLGTDLLRK